MLVENALSNMQKDSKMQKKKTARMQISVNVILISNINIMHISQK